MRIASRIVATLMAAVVWIAAGLTVASGPLATTAITPAFLDADACPGLAVERYTD